MGHFDVHWFFYKDKLILISFTHLLTWQWDLPKERCHPTKPGWGQAAPGMHSRGHRGVVATVTAISVDSFASHLEVFSGNKKEWYLHCYCCARPAREPTNHRGVRVACFWAASPLYTIRAQVANTGPVGRIWPPPCFIRPSTMFLPSGSSELSLNC